jgi:predicted lactoylglutathione lyase
MGAAKTAKVSHFQNAGGPHSINALRLEAAKHKAIKSKEAADEETEEVQKKKKAPKQKKAKKAAEKTNEAGGEAAGEAADETAANGHADEMAVDGSAPAVVEVTAVEAN